MSDAKGWIHFVLDDTQLEPVPAMAKDPLDGPFSCYNKKTRLFEPSHELVAFFGNYDECRASLLKQREDALRQAQQKARDLSLEVAHIASLPISDFPDVPQQAEAEEAKAETKAAKPEYNRPTRKQ